MNQSFEGIVLNGEIRLRGDVELPENTRVWVIVPDAPESARAYIRTPRLAHPEQASEFKMEVLDEVRDAGV
jgi:hypothetical protein